MRISIGCIPPFALSECVDCEENCSEKSADRYIELFIWLLSLSFDERILSFSPFIEFIAVRELKWKCKCKQPIQWALKVQ